MTGITLLNGATGFVGSQVLRALGDKNAHVRLVVRDEKQGQFTKLQNTVSQLVIFIFFVPL